MSYGWEYREQSPYTLRFTMWIFFHSPFLQEVLKNVIAVNLNYIYFYASNSRSRINILKILKFSVRYLRLFFKYYVLLYWFVLSVLRKWCYIDV